jgi:hypothetical protein
VPVCTRYVPIASTCPRVRTYPPYLVDLISYLVDGLKAGYVHGVMMLTPFFFNRCIFPVLYLLGIVLSSNDYMKCSDEAVSTVAEYGSTSVAEAGKFFLVYGVMMLTPFFYNRCIFPVIYLLGIVLSSGNNMKCSNEAALSTVAEGSSMSVAEAGKLLLIFGVMKLTPFFFNRCIFPVLYLLGIVFSSGDNMKCTNEAAISAVAEAGKFFI